MRNRTIMGANPDVAGKADGNTSNVGDVQKAQLPDIIGYLGTGFPQGWSADGAFYFNDNIKDRPDLDTLSKGPHKARWGWLFSASRAGASTDHLGNNVYIHNGEVRTANIRMNYIIKY